MGAGMTDLPLRVACEHGRYKSHYPTLDDPDWAANDERSLCPGGREVTDKELIERAGAAAIAQGIAEVLFI